MRAIATLYQSLGSSNQNAVFSLSRSILSLLSRSYRFQWLLVEVQYACSLVADTSVLVPAMSAIFFGAPSRQWPSRTISDAASGCFQLPMRPSPINAQSIFVSAIAKVHCFLKSMLGGEPLFHAVFCNTQSIPVDFRSWSQVRSRVLASRTGLDGIPVLLIRNGVARSHAKSVCSRPRCWDRV